MRWQSADRGSTKLARCIKYEESKLQIERTVVSIPPSFNLTLVTIASKTQDLLSNY